MANLLFYRFVLANVLLGSLAAVLWAEGYVWPVIEGGAPLNYGILGLFGIGLLWSFKEVVVVSSGLNQAKRIGADPAIEAEVTKDTAKVDWLSSVSEWLVSLGLIGTVIGMAMALAGLPDVTDAEGALKAVSHLGGGMAMAINTTLLGASLAVWHDLNCRLLKTGMAIYWADRLMADHGINARALH